jgi:hypothetical protein
MRAVWEQHPEYTAKQVIKRLPPRLQWVSVRRVQEILRDLRAESASYQSSNRVECDHR